MTLVRTLKELWRRRLLVTAAAVVAALVAIVACFQVSVSPPSVAKRSEVSGAGSIGILVDSARSPLADTARDVTGLTARAGVLARVMAGGNVVREIAAKAGVPANQIAVSGPVALPGEAVGSETAASSLPYGISFSQTGELPVISVETRAPTVAEARALAAAAPDAIRRVVRKVQVQQRTPAAKQVQFRDLGPAQAKVVEESSGARMALVVFLVVFALLLLAIIGWPRLADAWRSADAEAGPLPAPTPAPDPAPTVVHLPPGRIESPETGTAGETVGHHGEHR